MNTSLTTFNLKKKTTPLPLIQSKACPLSVCPIMSSQGYVVHRDFSHERTTSFRMEIPQTPSLTSCFQCLLILTIRKFIFASAIYDSCIFSGSACCAGWDKLHRNSLTGEPSQTQADNAQWRGCRHVRCRTNCNVPTIRVT